MSVVIRRQRRVDPSQRVIHHGPAVERRNEFGVHDVAYDYGTGVVRRLEPFQRFGAVVLVADEYVREDVGVDGGYRRPRISSM